MNSHVDATIFVCGVVISVGLVGLVHKGYDVIWIGLAEAGILIFGVLVYEERVPADKEIPYVVSVSSMI
jgi:hypothetical protein